MAGSKDLVAIAHRGPRDVAGWSMVACRRGGRSNARPMPPLTGRPSLRSLLPPGLYAAILFRRSPETFAMVDGR